MTVLLYRVSINVAAPLRSLNSLELSVRRYFPTIPHVGCSSDCQVKTCSNSDNDTHTWYVIIKYVSNQTTISLQMQYHEDGNGVLGCLSSMFGLKQT